MLLAVCLCGWLKSLGTPEGNPANLQRDSAAGSVGTLLFGKLAFLKSQLQLTDLHTQTQRHPPRWMSEQCTGMFTQILKGLSCTYDRKTVDYKLKKQTRV